MTATFIVGILAIVTGDTTKGVWQGALMLVTFVLYLFVLKGQKPILAFILIVLQLGLAVSAYIG